jgi:ABC-type branched-subunit amino acid transport system ATPase component
MKGAMPDAPILSVAGLSRRYGGVAAVSDISFAVRKGSITALIGPNGAGKTTALNAIAGLILATTGQVRFEDRDITRQRADQICRLGLGRTFQTPQIFRSMSVRDNVFVGTTPLGRTTLIDAALASPRLRREEKELVAQSDDCLRLVGLSAQGDQPIAGLSFGQIRLVEVARALASRPKLILMDEPASGLSRAEAQSLRNLLFHIKDLGVTILLVEHNMPLVMSTADHVLVLDKGRMLASGTPDDIKADARVRKAYLGTVE